MDLFNFTIAMVLFLLGLAAISVVLFGENRYRSRRLPMVLLFTFVFAGVSVVLTPLVFSERIGIFDEGFVVSGAMLILQGFLPIRDFFVIYGPGQYYLTAGVFWFFGEDLMVSRSLHVVLLACLGVIVALCTSRLVPRSRVWPAQGALVYVFACGSLWMNSGYAAVPAVLLLLSACLMFAHWVDSEARTSLLCASLLIGLAGVFRWDFGVFGFLSLTVTTAALLLARGNSRSHACRAVAMVVAPGLALAVVVFAPFIVRGDFVRWFDEVPSFHLMEFGKWRSLEFFRPLYWSAAISWAAGDTTGVSLAFAKLAYVAVTPSAALMAIAISARRVWLKRGAIESADALALLLGLMVLFLLNQMRVRSGFPQGFPALVASLPLVPYILKVIPARSPARRIALFALVTGLVFAPLHVVQSRLRAVMAAPVKDGLDIARATIMRVDSSPERKNAWDEYSRMVSHIRSTTLQGEPILSAVADTSRLFVNDAMLYFLADRPSATRWVEMEPGLTNTEQGQHELIAALESRNVRTVVLLTMTSSEPNATSRSNGIHLFDEYIRRNFTSSRIFGAYEIYVRKGS